MRGPDVGFRQIGVVVLVAVLALSVAGSGLGGYVGTVAAAGDAESASADTIDQVPSDSGTVVLENVEALDGNGNPTSEAVIVVTGQMDENADGLRPQRIVGIKENTGVLDGTDVTVDISTDEAPGSHRYHVFPASELAEGGALDGRSEGDVLGRDIIASDSEYDQFILPELLSGDGYNTPPPPPGIVYEAGANAGDVTVSKDSLGSVTLSGSPLGSFENGEDGLFDDFTVVVSDEQLSPGDGTNHPSVFATNDGNTGSVDSLTFDLSGEELGGSNQLYVSVYARGELVRVGNDDVVSDSFTLTVQEPDLQVTGVSPQDSGVVEGDTLTVDATVDNQGNAATSGQTVTFGVDANQDGSFTEVATRTVDVNPGSTQDLSFTYDTSTGDASGVDVRVTTEDDTEGETATASVLAPDSVGDVTATSPVDPREESTVTATVRASNGDPVPGVDVQFSADGAGSLNTTEVTSDADGEVAVAYTPAVGDAGETVDVTIEGADRDLGTASASVQVRTLNVDVTGPDGSVDPADFGSTNSYAVDATVTTQDGNSLDGVDVSFALPSGNGGLDASTATTDADGVASVSYTVGSGDWDLADGVQVEGTVDATGASDTTSFGVSEPRLAVSLAADSASISPTGTNTVTATATYEAPFDDIRQPGTVTFSVSQGAGTFEGGSSETTVSTGDDGQATVTYDPVEADFGSDVRVRGSVEEGTEVLDSTTFAVEDDVTVEATANLGVTAPADTDVTFELRGQGTTLTKTATTAADDGSVSVTFGDSTVLAAGEYTVEVVDADGIYETGVTATATPEPGGTATPSVDLAARDATVDVGAMLGVTAPSADFPVTLAVELPGGSTETKTVRLAEGATDLSGVDSAVSVPAVDDGEAYSVSVSATGYESAPTTASVAPGGSTTADVGTLAAMDTGIDATADLGVTAPLGGTDVTFTLVGPDGSAAATQTTTVAEGASDASVDFGAQSALDADEGYTVAVDAAGYETGEVTATTAGVPGTEETVDFGTLAAEDVALTVEGELGVTAPGADFPVTVTVTLPDESTVERTVELDAGQSSFETTLSAPAVDANEDYDVTVSADGYADASSVAGAVGPGESATVGVEVLAAQPTTVSASATLGVTAPPGGTEVTFELVGPDGQPVGTAMTTVAAGSDTASVGFEAAPALDYADSYTVTVDAAGYETEGVTVSVAGAPGSEPTTDLGTLTAEDVALTVSGELGVTAPEGGVDATVTVGLPDGETVERTVTVGAGETAVSVTAQVPAVGVGESYDVTVSAPGYEDATTTTYVEPGGSGTAEVGTLAARDATVTATADLGVTAPPGGVDVTFNLTGPDGEVVGTAVSEASAGSETATADFTVGALPAAESYTVTVDAPDYETADLTRTVAGAPGSEPTADFGTLAAENATLAVNATLGVTAPEDGFEATVTVGLPDGRTRALTVALDRGAHNLSAVDTTLDVPAIDESGTYDVTVSAPGYEDATTTTYAAPGASGTAGAGTLAAEDVELTVTATLGVTAPDGGRNVTLAVAVPGGSDSDTRRTVEVPAGEDDVSETFTVAAVDASAVYSATVTAEGYAGVTVEDFAPPGASGSAATLEAGTLAANETTIDVEAQFAIALANETAIDIEFDGPGDTGATETVTVPAGTVNLSAADTAFALPALDASEQYDVTVSTAGYSAVNASGVAPPDGEVVVDAGQLGVPQLTADGLVIQDIDGDQPTVASATIAETAGVITRNLTATLTVVDSDGTVRYRQSVDPGELADESTTVRFEDIGPFDDAAVFNGTLTVDAANARPTTAIDAFTAEPDDSGSGGPSDGSTDTPAPTPTATPDDGPETATSTPTPTATEASVDGTVTQTGGPDETGTTSPTPTGTPTPTPTATSTPTVSPVPAATTPVTAAEEPPTDAPGAGSGFPWWLLALLLVVALLTGGYLRYRQQQQQ